ncbi:unnamed protein product, partial [Rotaria sp. Silwood1]
MCAMSALFAVHNKSSVHELNFTIEYCDKTEKIKIFDNQSVDLNLSNDNTIHLKSIENGSAIRIPNHTTSSSKTSNEFPLTVLCKDKSGNSITHKLVLQPNTTISEIKKQIEHLTHIPVEEQSWQGLLGAEDSDELHQTLITSQTPLIVNQSDTSSNQQISTIRKDIKSVAYIAVGNSIDEFRSQGNRSIISPDRSEDELMDIDHDNDLDSYDDDVTVLSANNPNTTFNKRATLVPEGCTNDTFGLEHFSHVFHARYGSTGPILYIGPLDQTIQDSLYASIHTRRPLAIYLHNDQSVCANVFCSQVLSADSILEYLANNYVLWAWDVTYDGNQK